MKSYIKLLSAALLVAGATQGHAMSQDQFEHLVTRGVTPGMHPSKIYSLSGAILEGTQQAHFNALYKEKLTHAATHDAASDIGKVAKHALGLAKDTEIEEALKSRTALVSKARTLSEARSSSEELTARVATFDNMLHGSTFKVVTDVASVPAEFSTLVARLPRLNTQGAQYALARAVAEVLKDHDKFVVLSQQMVVNSENFDAANADVGLAGNNLAVFKAVLDSGTNAQPASRFIALAQAIEAQYLVVSNAMSIVPGFVKVDLTTAETDILRTEQAISALVTAFKN
jgi:hypothetical protein